MRTSALFPSILLCLTLQAQAYRPFPEGNATWVEHHEGIVGNGGNCMEVWANFHRAIYFGADEEHNGQIYHRLMYVDDGYTFCPANPGSSGDYHIGPYEHLAIRQDTGERKVYGWTFEETEELIFDFSSDVGDTVYGYFPPTPLLVTSIDTLDLTDGPHRRWHLEYQGGGGMPMGSMIEGVGGTMFNSQFWTLGGGFEYVGELRCFKNGETVVYADSTWGPPICDISIVTQDEDRSLTANEVRVHPNPSSGIFHIRTDGTSAAELAVLDLTGRQVLRASIIIDHPEARILDLSAYPSGIYLLSVRSNSEVHTVRLVKH